MTKITHLQTYQQIVYIMYKRTNATTDSLHSSQHWRFYTQQICTVSFLCNVSCHKFS